jgi:hypothetical protein
LSSAKERFGRRVRTARKATGIAKKRFMSGKLLILYYTPKWV